MNDTFDFMALGQAIKKAREAKGMTREQLAEILEPDFVFIKGKDFVFLCAKIDGIAQMVFVPGVFFFGRCVFLRGAA